MVKRILFIIAVLLTPIILLAVVKSQPGPLSCKFLSQNSSLYFSSINLKFNFSESNSDGGNYAHWDYDDDRSELYYAHYNNHTNDGINGYFDSFASIMDCYWNPANGYYHNNAPSREPSISVTYTGRCDGSVSCKYLPSQYDSNHWYTDASLVGAPLVDDDGLAITQGVMTVKSIKTAKHGIQLKWQYAIESNDISNIDAIAQTKSANTYPITMYAIITSDVPDDDSDNLYIIGVHKYLHEREFNERNVVKSSTEGEYRIVENTVPKELVGKTVELFPSNNDVCSPHLDGPLYIYGEYSTEVKWNKPSLYKAIVK